MLTLVKIFLIALLCSLVLTPLVRRLALRWDIVDHPDDQRKLHDGVMPVAGGLAVFMGFCAALGIAYVWSAHWRERIWTDWVSLSALLAAAAAICLLGLVDDLYKLRGRQKLLGQILVASVLIASGLLIRKITVFEYEIELGLLTVPFTLFWLLGATNALNLIDGVDGLATSVGIVLSLALSIMAMMTGHLTDAMLAMAVAGSLTGFWVYNSAPASIFLGDAGSMFIGLVLGTLAVRSSLKGPATIALIAPTALLAIPIMDVAMAIVRRALMGRSISSPDRGHLHHRLLKLGYGQHNTVLLISLLCIITAAGAVCSEFARNDLLAIIAVFAVVAMLCVTRLFGYEEFQLLKLRAKHFLASLIPTQGQRGPRYGQLRAHLHGNGQWDDLWETLTQFAERFDLSVVQLNVHLPAYGEEYHASWKRAARPDEGQLWHSDIPLIAHHTTVGRLRITGACSNGSVCVWMSDLISGLKPFETQLIDLIQERFPESKSPSAKKGEQRSDSRRRRTKAAERPTDKPTESEGEGDRASQVANDP
jgi:UDP-GlcNAc:undecaprenyl-phosphate/decaprenyl-phosphate GlcNAc-1-phosphate transferase